MQHAQVHADGVAFAHRGNRNVLPGSGFEKLLQCDRGSGRLVFLVHVMSLDSVPAIVTHKDWGDGGDGLEEKIHPYREIRAVEKSGVALPHQLSHFVDVLIPARRADHDRSAGFGAANDVGDHGVGSRKIDDYISCLQQIVRQTTAILVLFAGQRLDLVAAFTSYVGNQRAGFSPPQNEQSHAKTSGSTSEKNT